MASTYTSTFNIEKIGSGEQAGTWGTTSNHNWDIVDRLASYTAIALSDASTATLTIGEASPGSGTENLQNGMYRAIKFTGSLSQDCTITIGPNNRSSWFIIENAAGDDIILSQGSGANVTVQNGKNVIVYCDGAGSGAAVVDALADLQIGTLECTGAAAIDGAATFSSTVTVGVDDTGYDVKFFGATSGAYMLWDESADDLKLVGAAGLTVAGDIDVDGTTNLDAVDIDGAVQLDGTLTVGVDDTGYDVKLFGATSGAYLLWDESADDLILAGAAGLSVAGNSVLASVDVTGLATAATFEPDGDTAAGDNAAIGYTTAEGLILTGQGSTGDLTIKNDADATVAFVPTGTTKLRFPDDSIIQMGTGQDLLIYHDGSNSYITHANSSGGEFYVQGTNLILRAGEGESFVNCVADGAVSLYYDNAVKLATASGGVAVTGNLDLDGGLDLDVAYTVNPAVAITHTGTGSSTLFTVQQSAGNTYNMAEWRNSSGTSLLNFAASGNVTNTNNSYGAISDVKLKENIVDSGSQWDDIKNVRVRKFSFKTDSSSEADKIGVVAQELEASGMGGLVIENTDRDPDTFEDLETTTKEVKYSVLYMKSVKALQEAMTRIEQLEVRVSALEGA